MNKLFLPAVLILLLLSENLSAQQNLGPNPILAGMQVSCGGVVLIIALIPDSGQAVPGAIYMNPVVASYPPVVQWFIYAHECAHHIPEIGSNENLADAWGIKTGRDQGWIKPNDINVLQSYFISSPGDWTHLPGQLRTANFTTYYSNP